MEYREMLENAKKVMAPVCRVCKECNGRACRGEVPGSGGRDTGNTFTHNYDYLAHIKINFDVIYENHGQDCSTEFLGRKLSAPLMAAPCRCV